MPAGFNKGQVEYIKAIANVNGHKTYKPVSFNAGMTTASNDLTQITSDNLCRYRLWCLGQAPIVRDTAGTFGTLASVTPLNAFNIPIADTSVTPAGGGTAVDVANSMPGSTQRDGPEGFLESTHLRMRVLLPHKTDSFADDHCECRLLVFRAKDRQHHVSTHMKDVNNPYYNLFHGVTNYNVGFAGYEDKEETEGVLAYHNQTTSSLSGSFNVGNQDAMTIPVNKESWVVMKDHRFFLGKEYGGKNIYETTLHWDWHDPVSTISDDITETDNDKNYVWYVLLLANNNNFSTSNAPDINVRIMGTTHMTSG